MNQAKWALSCVQSDLRHRLAMAPGTTFLDNRNTVRLQSIIRCDEGGRAGMRYCGLIERVS